MSTDKGEQNAEAVARWMLEQVTREGFLSHYEVVPMIEDHFGERFTYFNANGNPAISPQVLSAFRRLSGESVVWSKRGKFWRPREPDDGPGREQA